MEYKTFTNNMDFIEWQFNNPKIIVCTIQPWINSMFFNKDNDDNVDANSTVGCFVTYYMHNKTNEDILYERGFATKKETKEEIL
jgi:hypothetical protein